MHLENHEEWKAKNQPLPPWTKYLWSYNQLIEPSPKFYELDLTNKCQLNCFKGKCCSFEERQKPAKFMTKDTFLSILKLAESKLVGIDLTGGGEPTLHPAFEYFVDKLMESYEKRRFSYNHITGIGLVTNGVEVPMLNYFMTQIVDRDDNCWIRVSLNDRKPSDALVELFHTYPNRIGLSLVYDPLDDMSFGQAARNKSLLGNVAKFVRMIPYNDLTTPSEVVTPKSCYGRKFVKIFNPDGVEQYCCLARGLDGQPPKFCPKDCRWEHVNPDDAWKCNPFT